MCVYRFGGLIDGFSALGVVYNVSLMVVMTMHAGRAGALAVPSGESVSWEHT